MLLSFLLRTPLAGSIRQPIDAHRDLENLRMIRPRCRKQLIHNALPRMALDDLLQDSLIILETLTAFHLGQLSSQLRQHILGSNFPALIEINRPDNRLKGICQDGRSLGTARHDLAMTQQQVYLARFCFCIVGALAGFLWFNVKPAELMMGDTGSQALGATFAVVALMTGRWLFLPIRTSRAAIAVIGVLPT